MVLEKDFFVCLVLVIMLHFVLMLFSQVVFFSKLSFRNIKYFKILIARFLILELGHEINVNYSTLPAKINQSSLETLTWLKFTDSFSSGDFSRNCIASVKAFGRLSHNSLLASILVK